MNNIPIFIRHMLCMIVILTLSACNSVGSPTPSLESIQLIVKLDKASYCINENIGIQVSLTNIGDTNVLIDGRWVLLPILLPPEMSSGGLYLIDSSGRIITSTVDIERMGVQKNDFVVLAPGETITRNATIHDRQYGDPDNYFRYALTESETYTVIAIYQNILEFSQIDNGEQIASWTGQVLGSTSLEIESNECLVQ